MVNAICRPADGLVAGPAYAVMQSSCRALSRPPGTPLSSYGSARVHLVHSSTSVAGLRVLCGVATTARLHCAVGCGSDVRGCKQAASRVHQDRRRIKLSTAALAHPAVVLNLPPRGALNTASMPRSVWMVVQSWYGAGAGIVVSQRRCVGWQKDRFVHAPVGSAQ